MLTKTFDPERATNLKDRTEKQLVKSNSFPTVNENVRVHQMLVTPPLSGPRRPLMSITGLRRR